MVETLAELNKEFKDKASMMGLEVQCRGAGAFHAEIAIVGEAPGDHEVQKNTPMVGASGSLLWKILRKSGIDRAKVYTTNVSKRQVAVATKPFEHARVPINKHEAQLWNGLLHWELSQLPNIRYVLVLGNLSLTAITGKSGITQWRGSVLDATVGEGLAGKAVRALCTYNPAMIMREPKYEITFRMDLGRLKRVSKDDWEIIPVSTVINPTLAEATDYLDHVNNDVTTPVAYDIETIGNETACVGFAHGPDNAICINFRTMDDHHYSPVFERQIRRKLQETFTNPTIRFVAQNNMFDATWLLFKDRIRVKPIWFDTMLGHHIIYPQLPHNLGYLTTQYTPRPYYKGEKDSWRHGGNINEFWDYNGQDCANTWCVADRIHAELRRDKLDEFFFSHVMRAQPYLAQMCVGGIKVDRQRKEEFHEVIGMDVEQLKEEFQQAVFNVIGDPAYRPNVASAKQMVDLYFTKLKLVGRGTSTDAENRKRMYAHVATTEPKRQILRTVDRLKKEQKFFNTYVTSAIDDDGRMRCTYNQTGVQSAPGRLSSSGMLWKNNDGDDTGSNLQNQPERAYEMYVADPGYVLGYFDLSQAEARYVAWDYNIETWMEQFERARIDGVYDAHRALASDMFNIPYDDVPTFDRYDLSKGHIIPDGKVDGDVTLRYVAKRCRHGLNYRMGPDRLSIVTGLSLAYATNVYRIYHKTTPELQRGWAAVEREVHETRTLFNCFGRRLIILERLTPESMESIIAFKPQSSVGDKVVQVIYQSQEDDRWPINTRMWLNIHDALMCEAPPDKIGTCLSIMKKYAEQPLIVKGKELIIPAETKVSQLNDRGYHSWGSLKECDIVAAT